jgi:hypothetical protein
LKKLIEIVVSTAGETRIETKGFSGSECREASKSLEQALGKRTSEQMTAEFYQSVEQRQSAQEGN